MKLVVNWQSGERELFDLKTDLSEAKNLAAAQPDRTNAMYNELSAYLKSVNAETLAERPASKAKVKKSAKNKAKQP
jgi:hypothetical protein